MPGRLEYERAIRRSDLPSTSRLVALTLATWADITSGIIPDRYMPSLSVLETATGLSRKAVRTHLDVLEDAGWIGRDRPDPARARAEGARTRYVLAVPAAMAGRGSDPLPVGDDVPLGRGSRPPKSHQSLESLKSPAGEGPSATQPPAAAEQRAGTERKPRRGDTTRGQMPLLLSVNTAAAAAAPGHRQLAELLTEFYGQPVTVRHAAAVALAVLQSRTPANPGAYVMAAVRRDPDRHRPTSLPPAYRAPQRRAAGDS